MAIIKCKMCGGDIELSADKTYGTCDSCGSTMTFPKVDDEHRANLFNRANHFRRQNEFDKAVSAYERILETDNADAEAHWGVVLSRFGIEYVEDPLSHERIPTCHRVQSASILTDADYLAALEYAPDGYSRSLYEAEAKRIADIQKGILAISAQEKPYDVFICYKETTDGGIRTRDSALAQDIYYQLKQEGFNVFFSRITLEDKLGQQYEPYIFAALNSAKVMLVVGTKPEYFNAVWVKNEWSRYLALMKQDRSRLLIPCYRDMDAYDLPDELSTLQSQDMGKIGFMQDLLHVTQKILKNKNNSLPVQPEANAFIAPNLSSLLERVKLFLEDKEWQSAADYCERILDHDPHNAIAYTYKLLVKLKIDNIDNLPSILYDFDADSDYQKAVRFSSGSLKAILEKCPEKLRRQNAEKYQDACWIMTNACTEQDFLQAAHHFSEIPGYMDAAEKQNSCYLAADNAKKQSIYNEACINIRNGCSIQQLSDALQAFSWLGNWGNAPAQLKVTKQKLQKHYENTISKKNWLKFLRIILWILTIFSIFLFFPWLGKIEDYSTAPLFIILFLVLFSALLMILRSLKRMVQKYEAEQSLIEQVKTDD